MADRGDAIADDADVSAHPRIAGSVDQFATTDQDVEHKTHILPNGYQTTRAAILARWPCRRGYRCFTIRGSDDTDGISVGWASGAGDWRQSRNWRSYRPGARPGRRGPCAGWSLRRASGTDRRPDTSKRPRCPSSSGGY